MTIPCQIGRLRLRRPKPAIFGNVRSLLQPEMSELSQQRPSGGIRARSAHPRTTDMQRLLQHVGFVPRGDIFRCSVTWPVMMLMTHSNHVACRIGKTQRLVQFFTSSQRDKELSCFALKEREVICAVQRKLPMIALKIVRVGRTEKLSRRRREFYVVVYQVTCLHGNRQGYRLGRTHSRHTSSAFRHHLLL